MKSKWTKCVNLGGDCIEKLYSKCSRILKLSWSGSKYIKKIPSYMKYLLRVYELCIKYYVSNVGKHALRYYIIDHFMFSATSLNIIPVIIPSNSKLTIFCLPQSLLEADAIVAVMNMMMVCGWLTA